MAQRARRSALKAWDIFSEAFQSFPYGVAIYVLPVQHGPANPLRLHATGLPPGMMLFPYDAYNAWRGVYPATTVQQLMSKLARRWGEGVAALEKIDAAGRKEAVLNSPLHAPVTHILKALPIKWILSAAG